ncbi:unnamed protein product, partial [Ectocarpus sp. 12 AP-2014]
LGRPELETHTVYVRPLSVYFPRAPSHSCWYTFLAFARCKRDEKALVHSRTAVPQRLGVTHE